MVGATPRLNGARDDVSSEPRIREEHRDVGIVVREPAVLGHFFLTACINQTYVRGDHDTGVCFLYLFLDIGRPETNLRQFGPGSRPRRSSGSK